MRKLSLLQLPQGEMIILARHDIKGCDNLYYVVTRSKNQGQFYGLALDSEDKIIVFQLIRNLLDFDFDTLHQTALQTNMEAVRLDAERIHRSKLVITFRNAARKKGVPVTTRTRDRRK